MNFVGLLLGGREHTSRKITAFEGMPAMGLDALASIAYGPEAALLVLAPLGAAAPTLTRWLMAPVLVLLALLYVTYRETIRIFPDNGGAYAVTRRNLGESASLLAASALLIDYVLNAAVGISAGVGALISMLPALHDYTLPLCLLVLAVLTLINLRGAMFSGRMLALPTYAFIASFAAMIALGVYRSLVAGGHPQAMVAPHANAAAHAASFWLLLRAFAVACSATTGVEAVSNSVSAFRDPVLRYGRRTLTLIVATLGVLLAGVCWLLPVYRIHAMDQSQPGYRSVLAQLAAAVSGHGAFFFLAMAVLLCVLMLSANTSFVAVPRFCRSIAEDGYLPKNFASAGNRFGMLFLAVCAAALLLAFGGITQRLIPLFTIGVLLGFTLSQLSLSVHGRRALRECAPDEPRIGLWLRFGVNAFGALVTGVVIVVVLISQFAQGAWIVLVAAPVVIALLKFFRRRRA